jgi:hypothetical protein
VAHPPSEAADTGRRNRINLRLALVGTAVAFMLAATFVGASFYTDQPSFCLSCHEMRPYYDAWSSGGHRDRWCVDCHTNGGYIGRMGHKFVALREVAVHFFGDPKFPLATSPVVPDSRCASCHERVVIKKPTGFDHERHADKGTCQACHVASGHDVALSALAAAGVLGQERPLPSISATFAVVGSGSANVADHEKVTCTRCHDMRKTGCGRCHALPASKKHPKSLACEQCHPAKPSASGQEWPFVHPSSSARCTSCHRTPTSHYKGECSVCHRQPGASFAFRHPSVGEEHTYRSMGCTKCHPSSYAKASCTCHDQGKVEEDD